MYRQIQQLRRGVDVIIATPGRLQDLISQGEATLAEVVVTVLDEADFMADLGFLPVVKELLDQTDRDAQRLLFSATLDGEVDTLVRRYLKDPARHEVVAPATTAPPAEHLAFSLAFRDKLQVATELAAPPGPHDRLRPHPARRRPAGREPARPPASRPRRSTAGCPRRRASVRWRSSPTPASPVLVATDVAARGIHVDDVSLVLHYDPPTDAKTYLHRSGRTARAGAAGVVVSLLLPDQVGQAKRRFRTAKVRPGRRPDPSGRPADRRPRRQGRARGAQGAHPARHAPWPAGGPRWASAPRR